MVDRVSPRASDFGERDLDRRPRGYPGLSAANALRERADAVHHTAQGAILTYADAKQTSLKDLSADAFWKSLNDGARWDRPPGLSKWDRPPGLSSSAPAPRIPEPESSADLPLVAIRQPYTPALVSPLMTKIYQESNLRLAPNRVALHPADARASGVSNGARAILQTRIGKCAVEVTVDPAVPPGAVQVGTSPGIQDVCGPSSRAKVVSV